MNAENKITYESFTERVARRANVSEIEADAYIQQFSRTAGDALEKGDDVQLYHFGRFHTTHVEERPGHNPKTGEELTIPEHTRVEFRPYKALLIAVNWPFRNLRTKMIAEEETGTRPSAIFWSLLALALVALIVVGITVVSRMFDQNTVAEPVADVPANVALENSTVQLAPIGIAPITDMATNATEAVTATEAAASVPIEPAPAADFVVAPGDTLWDISISQWGDASWWPVIYAENRAGLPARNPDLIETGSSLRIPVLEGGAARPTDADLRQKTEAYRMVADDYELLGHTGASDYRFIGNRGFGSL